MLPDNPRILVVDDELNICQSCTKVLAKLDYEVSYALNGYDALKMMDAEPFDVILTDLKMSSLGGMEVLRRVKDAYPDTLVIVMTGYASVSSAVEVMKMGALDYLPKPFTPDELRAIVMQAVAERKIRLQNQKLQKQEPQTTPLSHQLIGSSPKIKQVVTMIQKVAPTDSTVLVYGESGTGKELVAEAIHLNSERANQPFVKVNLGGISSTLFESEMFGHKKGAFTDARNDRIGRFQKADRGSIFLDEIGDLHRASQVKLLRVLQDRTFEILGSSQARQVDVRLICATNRNLNQMVSDGDFREDLYYRINLITVKLPSLRERAADIPILARHFVDNLKIIYGRSDLTVDDRALEWLKTLSWPGNIRELKNMVERTVLVSDTNLIQQKDFARQLERAPKQSTKSSLPQVGEMTLEEIEISMIQKALEFHTGNIKQVAQSLGLSRAALYRRIEKHQIE